MKNILLLQALLISMISSAQIDPYSYYFYDRIETSVYDAGSFEIKSPVKRNTAIFIGGQDSTLTLQISSPGCHIVSRSYNYSNRDVVDGHTEITAYNQEDIISIYMFKTYVLIYYDWDETEKLYAPRRAY